LSNHIGDPDLGGFRPLTVALLDSMPATPELAPVTPAPAHRKDLLSAEQNAEAKRVKDRMPRARFMCIEPGCCMDRGQIASYWYWDWKAELHALFTHHRVVRI
jgi:hypothetical protein